VNESERSLSIWAGTWRLKATQSKVIGRVRRMVGLSWSRRQKFDCAHLLRHGKASASRRRIQLAPQRLCRKAANHMVRTPRIHTTKTGIPEDEIFVMWVLSHRYSACIHEKSPIIPLKYLALARPDGTARSCAWRMQMVRTWLATSTALVA